MHCNAHWVQGHMAFILEILFSLSYDSHGARIGLMQRSAKHGSLCRRFRQFNFNGFKRTDAEVHSDRPSSMALFQFKSTLDKAIVRNVWPLPMINSCTTSPMTSSSKIPWNEYSKARRYSSKDITIWLNEMLQVTNMAPAESHNRNSVL